jgi:type VI secretion system protein ImpC
MTVRLTYTSQQQGRQVERELPLRLLLLGDFAGTSTAPAVERRPCPDVTAATCDQVLAGCAPHVALVVAGPDGEPLSVSLRFTRLADFAPAGVARQVPEMQRLIAVRAALSAGRRDPGRLPPGAPTTRLDIDTAIADLDGLLGAVLDRILHHPGFQALEAAWRGVERLARQAAAHPGITLALLAVSREELQADFEDAPELTASGLYHHVYQAGYGQFGGEPVAAVIALYEFGPSPREVALLQRLAAIGAVAHAPVIAAAAPRLFGLPAWGGLGEVTDPAAWLAGPGHAAWRAFRAHPDARSVGLALPRVLLRAPWDGAGAACGFAYRETVAHDAQAWLWGNPALLVADRLITSFAAQRWCLHWCGPEGGLITDLPAVAASGLDPAHARTPLEVLIGETQEQTLAELGLIPVSPGPGGQGACLHSAASCHLSPTGDLGAHLPYLFLINRLAHYLKIIQREQIGTWKERSDLERELGAWLGRLVIDMDDPEPAVRERHPLRSASVTVQELAEGAGWYRIAIAVQPHLTHLGAAFTLALVGRLDRSA